MTPERWRHVTEVFHAALAHDASARAGYLDQACASDHTLREEVDAMLAAHVEGAPVAEIAVDASVTHTPRLAAGAMVGPYRVTQLIGAGGMGEVYRARDTKLGRDVAIKVLPTAFTSDAERLARFEREARVLASLNHPNIGAIYGLEEADPSTTSGQAVSAIVLELLEGEPLADRVARGPLPVVEALVIARQIAEALDAAHVKSIVHRDLKPANIKITPAGVVKVLDFGLAKIYVGESAGPDLSHSPTIIAGTRAGMILGTAAYMSPEQARGQAVDKRTDIWAFGCVLYEMLTGRAAFPGATISDTIAAILEHEPEWTALPGSTPLKVRDLLQRCVRKDPKRRLHDIADARIELDEALSRPSALPTRTAVVESTSRGNRLPWWLAAITSGVALIALSALVWITRTESGPTNTTPRFSRVVRLTSGPALEKGPAISPDGKWIAYLSNARGSVDVWVKFLSGGEPANLTVSAGLDITPNTGIGGLDISPDGTRIAVMAKPRGSAVPFATWEIPAPLPGVARKLLDDGFLGARWSPDGRKITFIRAGSSAGDALWVADADGGNRREIIQARNGMHIHWPAWSSNDLVYFMRTFSPIANLEQNEIYRINPEGGAMEPVVSTPRRAMFPLPMPNGNGLIYASNPTAADMSLWWRSSDGRAQERLTTGIGEYAEPRISADGRTVVFTLYEVRQSLMRIALVASSPQIEAVTDGYGGNLDPSISPAGDRLVFTSSRTGNRNLWTSRMDGSESRPLTSGSAMDERPVFSPNGQQIAFTSDRGGRRGIWVIDAGGGTPRKLTDVAPLGGLSWSPDGRQIVYAATAGDWPGLWTVSVADGQVRRRPTPGAAGEPAWSPTRDVIAYLAPTTSGPVFVKLAFVDAAGQPQYTALPSPKISGGFENGIVAWSPDGKRLAVLSQTANAVTSIWLVDPDGTASPYRKLTELPVGQRIRGLAWTRDGAALVVGLHATTSDIVLLDQAQ